MISSDLRTLFDDSVHTRKNANGSYTLPLFEQLGIEPGMVAYVDDITLAGQYSRVNFTNNRLFVLEITPGDARFTENGALPVLATEWEDKTVRLHDHACSSRRHSTRRIHLLLRSAHDGADPNDGTLYVKNDDALNPTSSSARSITRRLIR